MFTGLVQTMGTMSSREKTGAGLRLGLVSQRPLPGLQMGESIAVDGVCLTVVAHQEDQEFWVDISPETLALTTLGDRKPASRFNLERALALGDRLGGHLVSGHVDGMGHLVSREVQGEVALFRFFAPPPIHALLVHKGSVAINGVSLTVNGVDADGTFHVMLIPHTLSETTLADLEFGHRVNLEADLVGKYIQSLVHPYLSSLDPLQSRGFITGR